MAGDFFDPFEGDLWGIYPVDSDGWADYHSPADCLGSQASFLANRGHDVNELEVRIDLHKQGKIVDATTLPTPLLDTMHP